MDMFNLFVNKPYTFLELENTAGGNSIKKEYEAEGIVKLRDGMTQSDNMEAYTSDSTIHIKPSEPFAADLSGVLVGHGIRVQNDAGEQLEYRIIGQIEGMDFESGNLEFYKVTVKKESLSVCPSSLPLE